MTARSARARLAAMLVLAAAGTAHGEDGRGVGARVYAERCSACHGEDGGGDGPAAAALVPRPRNFRSADFWRERGAVQELRRVVAKGKPGTMMAPFEGVLSEAEIDAVVAFLERFDPAAAAQGDGTAGGAK